MLDVNPSPAKLIYFNFQPLEVVTRKRDPQPQVVESNLNLFNLRSTIYKSWCLNTHFTPNISGRLIKQIKTTIVVFSRIMVSLLFPPNARNVINVIRVYVCVTDFRCELQIDQYTAKKRAFIHGLDNGGLNIQVNRGNTTGIIVFLKVSTCA